jgi:hypothetical protein
MDLSKVDSKMTYFSTGLLVAGETTYTVLGDAGVIPTLDITMDAVIPSTEIIFFRLAIEKKKKHHHDASLKQY